MTEPIHGQMPQHNLDIRIDTNFYSFRDPVTGLDIGNRMARAFDRLMHSLPFVRNRRYSAGPQRVWPSRCNEAEAARLTLLRTVGTRELSR